MLDVRSLPLGPQREAVAAGVAQDAGAAEVALPGAGLPAVRVEAADLPEDAVLGVPLPQADALSTVRPAARLQLAVAEVEPPRAVPLAVEVAANTVGSAI